jgi:outer membrane murein-binding lipoprotein Lpp
MRPIVLPAVLVPALVLGSLITWRVATSDIRAKISSLDSELDRLTALQDQRQRELEEIAHKVRAAQHDLAEARAQLEFERCEAKVAEIRSTVRQREASCLQKIAELARCEAANEARKAKNSVAGTLLGLGLAAVTGGGSLLLAAGGAAVGMSTQGAQCPPPDCESSPDAIEAALLQELGISVVPTCVRATVAESQAEPTPAREPGPVAAAAPQGCFQDTKSGEILCLSGAGTGLKVAYRASTARPTQTLIVLRTNPSANQSVVRFSKSPKEYVLTAAPDSRSIHCQNPDGTAQTFARTSP